MPARRDNVDSELHDIPDATPLPLVIHRGVLSAAAMREPERCEMLFGRHGWRNSWQDGIYPYRHFHAATHEVVGIAKGAARVRFGGKDGPLVTLAAGDVAIIPAGVSHRRESASKDLLVVGAYPDSGDGNADIHKGMPADHPRLQGKIERVPLPATDPVFGKDGPLLRYWSEKSAAPARGARHGKAATRRRKT